MDYLDTDSVGALRVAQAGAINANDIQLDKAFGSTGGVELYIHD
jgi:hypothetical protein